MLKVRVLSLAGVAAIGLFMAMPANALTMAECSTKYNAAKDAGTLAGQTWNQFRKDQCGSDASATPEPAKPAKKAAAEKKPAAAADKAAAEAAPAGLSMKECSAKYQAAKDAGTLGDVKWNDFRRTQCAAGASAAVEPAKPAKTAKAEAPAAGLSMKDCSAKYQAAKDAGTLGGLKWNAFRKANCSADASDDETVPAPTEAQYTSEPEKATTAAPRGVKFPRSVAAKFSSETPGKARLHTCLEQYYANKDADTLGGLRWIQKGGGYYSLCNDRLKG
ncbi:hypothetical protein [Aminobacter sp. MET-1]|uniref:hypothetical protein n=1 Tax=Aminobacter sp. MET-1 TaxID=2951085 RepID=UPI002269BA1A|nr:hypothetical protein [Aminobacter sp. MET-1]MCX8572979.1 hypothetical protein [Aminobacter sp. MET-1]